MKREERKAWAEDWFAFEIDEALLSEKSSRERDPREEQASRIRRVISFVSCRAV